MLYSKDPCATGKRPVFVAWFGNFFEPYFSDPEAIEAGLRDLRELGMNSVVLDSKLWSDFSTYFATGKESQYVRTQNLIREKCEELGLGVSFLAVFAIGDNLYPEIYDHPPEYVDQPVDHFGEVFRGYRHWSEKQTAEHARHCLDLYKHIARGAAAKAVDEEGRERLPFYFYHSPIFAPSFDEEGRDYYLAWLKDRYTVEQLNDRYQASFSSIDAMTPVDYWVHPDAAEEEKRFVPSEEDYQGRSPLLLKHADNQKFKHWVMRRYFENLVGILREKEPRLYFYAGLSQWKFFFNDFIHIQNRGWDLWDMGKILDSPTFITMPVDNHSYPEPYVVPCELAMLRSAAGDKDFVAALFIGRFMGNDIYSICSPAEVLASAFGAGGTDLYFYGYNGLDDGGNFEKWPVEQRRSLKDGLDWFSEVRNRSGKRRRTGEAAILFPFASYHLSAFTTDSRRYVAFREDLMGWYKQLSDHGVNPDILHPSQVKAGCLSGYKVLAVPADPLYWAMRDQEMEQALRKFVEEGGVLVHSISDVVHYAFDLKHELHSPDSFEWEEKIVTGSFEFAAYEGGSSDAVFLSDRKAAITSRKLGHGSVYSFGFHYGYAYDCREHLPVARCYKKQNHYPLSVARRTPVDKLLADLGLSKGRHRGVETIPFQNGKLVINHTPYTVELCKAGSFFSTFEGFDGVHLPGRHAAFTLFF